MNNAQNKATMTISQNIIKFNVNSSVFEVKASDHNLSPDTARLFMAATFGNGCHDLNDVETFIMGHFPDMSELMQNELAEAIVKTLFASHNVSLWA